MRCPNRRGQARTAYLRPAMVVFNLLTCTENEGDLVDGKTNLWECIDDVPMAADSAQHPAHPAPSTYYYVARLSLQLLHFCSLICR